MSRPLPLDVGPELTVSDFRRYARQVTLREFGVKRQRQLKSARVLVLGAGGLGSPVLLYLAAAGVGTIGIVDFDAVEESNLHRQVIHPTAAVGGSKVSSAIAAVAALNPEITVVPHEFRLTEENAATVFSGYDVVLDGTDNFPTRYLANDTCVALAIPLVWASVLGFAAQISVFWPAGGGPQLRDLFPQPPRPGTVPNCSEAGVIGALCGQVGSVMATEAIKVLTGLGEPLMGRVVVIDALRAKWDEVPLRPAAGVSATRTAAPAPERADRRVPVTTTATSIHPGPVFSAADRLLLDVREPTEFAEGHLPGSLNMPLHRILAGEDVPGERSILVICRSGMRAEVAGEALTARGLAVDVLEGGILGLPADTTLVTD